MTVTIDDAFRKHVQALQSLQLGTEIWAPEQGVLLSSVEYLRQAVQVALIDAEARGEAQALALVLEVLGEDAVQQVKARLDAELLHGRAVR